MMTWCFEPGVRQATVLGPVWAVLKRPNVGAVDHRPGHVELVGRSQLAEQHFVQALPHAASFQSRSLRQHVIPDPNPSSWGRYSHRIAVQSTNRIPHNTLRSSRGLRPGNRCRRGSRGGNSGAISAHKSSDTIHGGCSPLLTFRQNDPHVPRKRAQHHSLGSLRQSDHSDPDLTIRDAAAPDSQDHCAHSVRGAAGARGRPEAARRASRKRDAYSCPAKIKTFACLCR